MRGSYLNDPCRELRTGEPDDESRREWEAEGMATAADPDPYYGVDLDEEDDDEEPF